MRHMYRWEMKINIMFYIFYARLSGVTSGLFGRVRGLYGHVRGLSGYVDKRFVCAF
jgi:hypothetical protein